MYKLRTVKGKIDINKGHYTIFLIKGHKQCHMTSNLTTEVQIWLEILLLKTRVLSLCCAQ